MAGDGLALQTDFRDHKQSLERESLMSVLCQKRPLDGAGRARRLLRHQCDTDP
jgi:hypothetical protein